MEYRAAVDAGDVIVAEKPGVVTEVSADLDDRRERRRHLLRRTGWRSSAAPTRARRYNQRVLVDEGDRVEAGTVLADGPSHRPGRDGAGQATCSWRSCRGRATTTRTRSSCRQRLVQDDVLSSIHIEEHEVDARDTKLGPEEITRDIPNVSEEVLADLDERGHHPHRRRGRPRRHPRRQGHAQGRDRAHPGGAPAARDLRREGPRGARHLAQGAARRVRQGHRRQGLRPRGGRRAAARASTSWSASTSPRSARSPTATSWPAATATRASSPRSCPSRTCRSSRTAPRSTSCSTRSACPAA